MPRYFFDIDDSNRKSRDTEGTELPDREAVRREATGILPDIARGELPNGNHRTFVCRVRDETGQEIFVATLTWWRVEECRPRRRSMTPVRPVAGIDLLARKLGRHSPLSLEEHTALHALPIRMQNFGRGQVIVDQGSSPDESAFVAED